MKCGQTSVIHFVSNFVSSILGFVATVYIARMLGAGSFGIYQVAVGLVSWLAIIGKVGIAGAVSKRISESIEPGQYAAAGLIVMTCLFIIISTNIILFGDYITNYVGYPVTSYVILILFVVLLNRFVNSLLTGIKLVQINGVLSPVRTGGQALAQIGLITTGAGTTALFAGHILGSIVAIFLGGYYVHRYLPSIGIPERRHFTSLFDFAKFSWLGNLQSRMFNYTDVLVLGLFVSSNLIGVYSAAWNISQFLILFSASLRTTLFPEMSNVSAREDPQAISRIVRQSLTFAGLVLTPGLFGGILLGERILQIYGPEFSQGAGILIILIVANLFMGYKQQLMNTLNAIDRPDLAFRVNAVFIASNIALNIVLIYFYGWLGAAVATAISVMISLTLAYRQVDTIIDFELPINEIARQWVAAAVMTVFVYGGLLVENKYNIVYHNFVVVIVLVMLGAAVYIGSLFILSEEFRTVIGRNVSINI